MGRYLGKICEKHPELEGARYDSNSLCVRCHQIKCYSKPRKKKPAGTYFGKICEKHPEMLGERYNSSYKCKKCQLDRTAKFKSTSTEYRIKSNKKVAENCRRKYPAIREKILSKNASWDGRKEWQAKQHKKRRTAMTTPLSLAYIKEIREIYNSAPDGMTIDHIVPLQGKSRATGKRIVCGLHVPWNLTYMKREDNSKKGAWFDE